jgi:hypothetical protein
MNTTGYQFETEESIVRENLLKAGFHPEDISKKIESLKLADPEMKVERNIIINQISKAMRSRPCALQAWYVYELLSKLSGLVPEYVRIISTTNEPDKLIINRRKNQNQ